MTSTRTPPSDLSPDALAGFLADKQAAYADLQARGLKLDLTRGKPSSAQLDLSERLIGLPTATKDRAGVDVRNYGGLEGLAELREIFAELLWVDVDQVICQGNSSLSLMHQTISFLMLVGRARLGASVEGRAGGEVRVPGAGLRPALLDAGRLRHRDGDRADARRRPRRRRGGRPGARRPERQGHLDRADVREPDRRGGVGGGRGRADGDADRRPGLPDLLGQRLRLPPPDRGRGEERRRAEPRPGVRPPEPADHVRVDLEDHLRRRRGLGARGLDRQQDLVPQPPRDGLRSAPTRSTTCGTWSSSGPRTAYATTCAGTARSSRRSSRPSTPPSPRSSKGSASPSGAGRPAATSSTSTSSTVRRPGSSNSPRRPASPSRPPERRSPTARTRGDRNIRLAPTFPQLDEVETAMAGVATCVALAAAEHFSQ